jgi:hypothetical protein
VGGAKGSVIWAANGINSFLTASLVEGIISTSKMESGRCQFLENEACLDTFGVRRKVPYTPNVTLASLEKVEGIVTIFSQHGRDGHGVCDGNFVPRIVPFCKKAVAMGNITVHSMARSVARNQRLPIQYP